MIKPSNGRCKTLAYQLKANVELTVVSLLVVLSQMSVTTLTKYSYRNSLDVFDNNLDILKNDYPFRRYLSSLSFGFSLKSEITTAKSALRYMAC